MNKPSLPRSIFGAIAAVAVLAGCGQWSARRSAVVERDVSALLAAGDSAGAIARLEDADVKSASDPAPTLRLAALYRARGSITDRLMAQRLLERALQRWPGDPDVLMELGKTYYAQTFFPDAVRCFRRVLEIDPARCAAHRYLGDYYYRKWKRVTQYLDDLDSARLEFERTLACDSTQADVAVRYAQSLYVLDRPDSARRACEHLSARFPERGEFEMLLGVLDYDRQRYAAADSCFRRGLALLPEEKRDAYLDVGRFLPADERDDYEDLAPNARDAYRRNFWLNLDPDPTTRINERFLEHIQRMALADAYYTSPDGSRPGWDTERGQALVKFGWPQTMASTLGGSWRDGRTETWTYVLDGELHEFVFVDEFLNGNLRIPYRADAELGFLRYAPKATEVGAPSAPVPGSMSVFTFKDNDLSSTVCVALRVPADSLARRVDLSTVDTFVVRGALFDDAWEPERRLADTLATSDVPPRPTSQGPAYEVVRSVSMPFDRYHVAFAFEDGRGVAGAQFRGDGDSGRYAGDGLVLSDVVPEIPRGGGPSLARPGYTLHPSADARYRPGESLPVYFEIYNLGVRGGRSRYAVTFHIYEAPGEAAPAWKRWGTRVARAIGIEADRPPTISQTFERSGTTHVDDEHVRINIDALAPGAYDLVVTVADSITGETSSARVRFVKQEPEA